MGIVLRFAARRHGRASAGSAAASGRKNASIGTALPERSLSLFASESEASFRPAKMLRRCDSEHPAASAASGTVVPLACSQRSIGCDSSMFDTISTRNASSQPEIFPQEIISGNRGFIKWGMAGKVEKRSETINLGPWLDYFEVGATEAAKAAGCKQPYISNIVGGRKSDVNVLYMLKLSRYLGITVNDFYEAPPSKATAESLARLSETARETIIKRAARRG